MSSFDRRYCLTCSNANIDSTSLTCGCASNQIIVEDLFTETMKCQDCPSGTTAAPLGSNIRTYCYDCGEGKVLSQSGTVNTCICDENYVSAGPRCILSTNAQIITSSYPVLTARTLTFNYMDYSEGTSIYDDLQSKSSSVSSLGTSTSTAQNVDSITISSDLINYLYLDNSYSCLNLNNSTACEVLANLCVLQMYDESNPACSLYLVINNSKNIYNSTLE